MNLNKVQLIGRLGRNPEIRTFPNGGKVVNASIATTEKWRDRESGQIREHTEWHDLVFDGRLADLAGEKLNKGSLVYVEGNLRTRKGKDKETGLDRTKTEVHVNTMEFGPMPAAPRGADDGDAEGSGTRRQDRHRYVGDPNEDERAPF